MTEPLSPYQPPSASAAPEDLCNRTGRSPFWIAVLAVVGFASPLLIAEIGSDIANGSGFAPNWILSIFFPVTAVSIVFLIPALESAVLLSFFGCVGPKTGISRHWNRRTFVAYLILNLAFASYFFHRDYTFLMPVWEPAIVDVSFFVVFVSVFPAAVIAFGGFKDRSVPIRVADAKHSDAAASSSRFRNIPWKRRLIFGFIALLSWSMAIGFIALLIGLNKEYRIASRDEVVLGRILYPVFTLFFLTAAYVNLYAGCESLRQRWVRGLVISLSTVVGLYLFLFTMTSIIDWHTGSSGSP